MYGFEFAAFVIDISLGFVCSLLGLIHVLERGKDFETISGLIELIVGVVATIITMVYVAFSGIIFSTETLQYYIQIRQLINGKLINMLVIMMKKN